MSTPYPTTSLRRTFAILAASSSLFLAADIQAQTAGTVTLQGASGNSCTYSSLSVTPSGGVTVQCSGTTTPPPPPPPSTDPGSFGWESATLNVASGGPKKIKVVRTGGNKGAYKLSVGPYGAACWGQPDSVNVADGQNSVELDVTLGTVDGTFCEYTLLGIAGVGGATGGALGTTKVLRVNVSTTAAPPPSNCPATPANMLTATLPGLGNPLLQMQASGQIVAIKVPNVPRGSGMLSLGESAGGAYTPQPVTLELSINKCPGVIDTDYSNFCNLRSTNGNFNAVTWLSKPYQSINGSNAALYGYCWAGDPGTQYYINARWTYSSCAFGAQVCGFAIQYNEGPY